jgi:hypothetical protein
MQIYQSLRTDLITQGAKAGSGFQTARSALVAELRKSGRQLPLQLKNAEQRSEARQAKAGIKKGSSSSAACMFPEGQGTFNNSSAPRQGLLRGRGARRPDAAGDGTSHTLSSSETPAPA